VTGLTIVGHGNDSNTTGHAVSLVNTRGLSFTGNTIIEPSPIAIYASANNLNVNISGNTIIDPWTDDQAAAKAVYFVGTASGYIGDNIFSKSSKLATNVLNQAVHLGTGSQKITLGKNYSEATTYLLDGQDSALTGRLGVVTTDGTGKDILRTRQIEANRVGVGNVLEVKAAGNLDDNNNGTKQIELCIGATCIDALPAADYPTGTWTITATVVFNGASQQTIQWQALCGTTITSAGYVSAAEEIGTGFEIKTQGECSDGADLIRQYIWKLDAR
jgi:hypothetical protein